MLTIYDAEMRRLIAAFKKDPERVRAIAAKTVNKIAFDVHKRIPGVIRSQMTSRASGLFSKALWVDMASRSSPLTTMSSMVGSTIMDRFSGWLEQEKGATDPRKRHPTVTARGGSKSRQVLRGARLLKKREIASPKIVSGRGNVQGDHHRAVIMLQMLGRVNHRKPFIISGHNRLRGGLWKIEGGWKKDPNEKTNMRLLQAFDRKPESIKKRPWMSISVRQYFKKSDWYKKGEFDRWIKQNKFLK